MGGHHHHHPPPVPDWRSYKAEDIPELRKLQQRLAKHGLKDPWIRNVVWRFDPSWGTPFSRLGTYFFRGFLRVGLPAFLLTIAAEKAFGGDDHHHDGEHH